MKRLLIIPVIAALALVAGTVYGRWNSDDDHGGRSASAVPSEGIDVHGDWRIAIYNEDGSLDREYAFANALRPNAAEALGVILNANSRVANRWMLVYGHTGAPSQGPCEFAVSGSEPLLGRNEDLTQFCFSATNNSDTPLTVESIPNGLRLSGSQPAIFDDRAINYVESWVGTIDTQTGAQATYAFTGTDVGPFEHIEAGQVIQVEVEITFNTPTP